MIVYGGLNCVDLRDKETHAEGPDEPYATVEPLAPDVPALPFILANTGVQRHSGQYHANPRRRWEQDDPAAVSGFSRIGELGRLGKKALVRGDWQRRRREAHPAGPGPGNEHRETLRTTGQSSFCGRHLEAVKTGGDRPEASPPAPLPAGEG